MNKQTEALKMAIEALEYANDIILGEWSEPLDEALEAIQACKEALEQPAPKNCTSLDEFIVELEKDADFKELMKQKRAELLALFELEQPAQEPVAWRNPNDNDRRHAFMWNTDARDKEKYTVALYTHPAPQPAQEPVACKVMAIDFDTEDGYTAFISLSNPIEIGTKLYTHPAPSWQGLSDDEINEYWYQSNNDVEGVRLGFTTQQHYFARAIEQALKEKNNG